MRKYLLVALLPAVCLAGCESTFDPSRIAGIEIVAPVTSILVGEALQLTLVASDSSGASVSSGTIRWDSSDLAVAVVKGGKVFGVSPGTVTIAATVAGLTANTTVSIASPFKLRLPGKLALGGSGGSAFVPWGSGESPPVEWSSSPSNILQVDQTGFIRPVGVGRGTIVARSGTIVWSGTLTVVPPYGLQHIRTGPIFGSFYNVARAPGSPRLSETGSAIWNEGTEGFLWREGQVTALGTLRVRDVNSRDEVVGCNTSGGFLWKEGTFTTVFPSTPNWVACANAINNAGAIAGFETEAHPTFTWSQTFFLFKRAPDQPGTRVAGLIPIALSATDFAVGQGGYRNLEAASYVNGGVILVGPSAPSSVNGNTGANDVNDTGEIVGFHAGLGSWLRTGGSIVFLKPDPNLPPLPGFAEIVPFAINNRTEVVGTAVGARGAALWRIGEKTDFEVLQQMHADPEWTVIAAVDINDRGQVLVIGMNRVGERGLLLMDTRLR